MLRMLLAITMCIVPVAASAQQSKQVWECVYSANANLEGVRQDQFFLEFEIEIPSGKSVVHGNLGAKDVDLYIGEQAFSFIERVDVGSVQTTTIMADGRSVHSRHTVLLGQPAFAQHYGSCRLSGR